MNGRVNHADTVRRALVNVPAVCAALGIERSKTERDKWVCPEHGGGSLSVRIGKDGTIQVKCFGRGCDLAGDVLGLIAERHGLKMEGPDFTKVLIEGARMANLYDVLDALRAERGPARELPAPTHLIVVHQEIPPLEAEAFDTLAAALLELTPLKGQPDVWAYLKGRALDVDAEAHGWGALPVEAEQADLIDKLTRLCGADALARSGLVAQGRPKFVFSKNRLVIPWRSPSGAIETLQRRLIRAPVGTESKYVFPKDRAPSHPYGVDAMRWVGPGKDIAFVEGAFDVLALINISLRNRWHFAVLGLPGVQGWNPEWLDLAKGRVALVAFDADAAGDNATKFSDALHRAGAQGVKRFRPRYGKDWAELLTAKKAS